MSDLTDNEIISDELKVLYQSFLNELTEDELRRRLFHLEKEELITIILEEDPTGKEDDRFRDSIR